MSSPALKLIDADVHNGLEHANELLPFLPRYWQEEVRVRGLNLPTAGYVSPVGVLREDARPHEHRLRAAARRMVANGKRHHVSRAAAL